MFEDTNVATPATETNPNATQAQGAAEQINNGSTAEQNGGAQLGGTQTDSGTTEQQQVEQPPAPSRLKIKYNGAEEETPYEIDGEYVKIPLTEAATHIQKSKNYETAIEKERQRAADAAIAAIGQIGYDGKPITTMAQMQAYIEEYNIRQMLGGDADANVDPEIIKYAVKGRQKEYEERAALEAQQREQHRQERIKTDNELFVAKYPPGTIDYKSIPNEVFEARDRGEGSLIVLYEAHVANTRAAQLEAELKALKGQASNAAASGGSAGDTGAAGDGSLTQEFYDSKKGDLRWVYDNMSAISSAIKKGIIKTR